MFGQKYGYGEGMWARDVSQNVGKKGNKMCEENVDTKI